VRSLSWITFPYDSLTCAKVLWIEPVAQSQHVTGAKLPFASPKKVKQAFNLMVLHNVYLLLPLCILLCYFGKKNISEKL